MGREKLKSVTVSNAKMRSSIILVYWKYVHVLIIKKKNQNETRRGASYISKDLKGVRRHMARVATLVCKAKGRRRRLHGQRTTFKNKIIKNSMHRNSSDTEAGLCIWGCLAS